MYVSRTYLRASLHAVPEHANAKSTIILGRAFVKLLKVDSVLEGAVFDEASLGNMPVVPGHAHGEAQKRLGVGIELLRAELNDIPKALLRAMLAGHTVVIRRLPDEGQSEVDFAVGFLHRWKHEIAEAVLSRSAHVHGP